MCHSDVKPANSLLCIRDARVFSKICDMGMTVPIGSKVKGGTITYDSPEKVLAKGSCMASAAQDMYAAAKIGTLKIWTIKKTRTFFV